jgi:ketosteroid isomerase-like protein
VSQENVELVKAAFVSLSNSDLPAFLEALDAEVEWQDREDALDPAVFRGHEGIRRLVGGVARSFTDWTTEATDFIEAGERVVVPVRHTGTGRASGIPVDEHEVYVCTVADRKIVEVREYKDLSEALQAVGLED